MSACRLLAIDLDGTLLRDDGEIAPEDRAAIERAAEAGIGVTLATGRLGPGALPHARALGLSAPLVCADGGATFCASTERLLDVSPLPLRVIERLLDLATDGLSAFLVTPDAILGSRDAPGANLLEGWIPQLSPTDDLREALLGGPPLPIVAAFAVGDEQSVRTRAAAFVRAEDDGADVDVFSLADGGPWAFRLSPAGVSKGVALERIAEQLGLDSGDVAVIGDWYNDIAMLRWAGHSFAMGQAPAPVVEAARHHLRATARTGGGVAEALDRLLGPRAA
jgi:hydroxymethylpyrimidine pyrophosphatase-like HAD family hydrolase